MIIKADQLGKRYRYEWIFKGFTQQFDAGQGYAVTGGNGSGKSTLLQVLSGHRSPSKGQLTYQHQGQEVMRDHIYQHISYAAPYIELLEEYTLMEAIAFHYRFKPMHCTPAELLERLKYPKSARHKPVRYFSSGMQQRLKLALTIASDTAILLLDEPTITLDRVGVAWYRALLEDYGFSENRLTIIASNVEEDYAGCGYQLDLLDYKKEAQSFAEKER